MKRSGYCCVIALFACLAGITARAQQGEIRGIVLDSAYRLKLPSATVSVYTEDSVLVQFTLTNNIGAFSIRPIPLYKTLRLYASYTGYKIAMKTFMLDSVQPNKDFKSIHLTRDSITLKEVEVKSVVPVRMSGDTLVINADAFTLDKNAVVEDLLRKISAITIWGDGTITVNGKKVSKVYVDGKPFFSGDAKIALQNLDKASVNKIEVYNDVLANKFADTVKTMNIVLKEDKKTGYFGKAGAGKGLTGNSHDVDLAFNGYRPQTQIGIAGSHNSINKKVNSLNQVFLNSTYKGNMTDDYSTDFNMLGDNVSRAAGVFISRDFLKNPETSRSHQINGEYFYNRTKTNIRNTNLQTYNFRPDSIQQNQQTELQEMLPESHQFLASYMNNRENNKFQINLGASNLQNNQFRDLRNITSRNGVPSFSRSDMYREDSRTNAFNLKTEWDTRNPSGRKAFKGIKIEFLYGFQKENGKGLKKSDLRSLNNPESGQFFDRKFNGITKKNSIGAKLQVDDAARLIFLGALAKARINLSLGNEINYTAENIHADVLQYDTTQHAYFTNGYLTNARQYNLLEETPSLTLNKGFLKESANRYSKSLLLKFHLPLATRFEQSRSEKDFQNYSRHYVNLLPAFSVNYSSSGVGKHQQRIGFDIIPTMSYPAMHMIAPLVDSTYDIIQTGNSHLKAGKNISYKLGYSNLYRDFKFSASAAVNRSVAALTTNTEFDAFNRRFITYVNADRNNTSGEIELKLQNAYKLNRGHQLQVAVSSKNIMYQMANYFSHHENIVEGVYSANSVTVDYTFRALLQLRGSQSYNFNNLKHSYLSSRYKVSTWVSYVNLQITPVPYAFIRTDLRHTTQHAFGSTIPYTIWNASAGFRLLDKRNLELKFSAMDLLKQNQNVRNIVNDMYVNLSETNMLQQYFMLSVAFYPRRSGKGK